MIIFQLETSKLKVTMDRDLELSMASTVTVVFNFTQIQA